MIKQLLDEPYWKELPEMIYKMTKGQSVTLRETSFRKLDVSLFLKLLVFYQPLPEDSKKPWTHQEILTYCDENLFDLKRAMIHNLEYRLPWKQPEGEKEQMLRSLLKENDLQLIFNLYKGSFRHTTRLLK